MRESARARSPLVYMLGLNKTWFRITTDRQREREREISPLAYTLGLIKTWFSIIYIEREISPLVLAGTN